MKITSGLILALFLLGQVSFVFADITIKAEVDKTAITTDDTLTYKLTLASTEKDISVPKIPGFKGFAVVSQAQSSTVSFQKGGMQTVLEFAFILLPQEVGKIKIDPAQVKNKEKVYNSEAFLIEVKQGRVRIPPREEESGPQIPDSDQPKYNL